MCDSHIGAEKQKGVSDNYPTVTKQGQRIGARCLLDVPGASGQRRRKAILPAARTQVTPRW